MTDLFGFRQPGVDDGAMMDGMSLTIWTARASFAFYVLALALRMTNRSAAGRVAWTMSLASLLAHLACAFHFQHGWSHRAAYEHTAQRTAETIGIAWGGGL